MDFLPKNYKVPSSGDKYMKLEKGKNQFRILSNAVLGWEDWRDNKPVRYTLENKPDHSIDPKRPIKHFWAFVVYNYNEEKVQILEITQKTIQKALNTMISDEAWGDPRNYDISITREGEGMETEYFSNPIPPKPLSADIKEKYDKTKINLEALFSGEDPFGSSGSNEDIDPETIDL